MLGDFMLKNAKLGRGIWQSILHENRLGWSEICCVEENHSYICAKDFWNSKLIQKVIDRIFFSCPLFHIFPKS